MSNPFQNVLTVPPSFGPPFQLHRWLLITHLPMIKYSRCCGCLRILLLRGLVSTPVVVSLPWCNTCNLVSRPFISG